MASRIGSVDVLREEDDFESYIERVELFIEVNNVEEDKRLPCLLSLIGSEAYQILKSLVSPELPKNKTFEECVQTLRSHYCPKPLVIMERFRFMKRHQKKGELIKTFVADLKKLCLNCDFGANLTERLRDQFVVGINDENIQKRLLRMQALTFDKAVELAYTMEMAAKDTMEIRPEPSVVHKMTAKQSQHQRAKPKKQPDRKPFKGTCWRCKGKHKAHECNFKNAKCYQCGKIGHIQAACHSLETHHTEVGDAESAPKQNAVPKEENTVPKSYDVFSLKVDESIGDEPDYITVVINDVPVSMEADNGSARSIMSVETFEKLWPKETRPTIVKETMPLRTYTKEPIPVAGSATVHVVYEGCRRDLKLWLVTYSGPTLMGRSWSRELGLQSGPVNYTDNEVSQPSELAKKVLQEFPQVFEPGLGVLKDAKASIQVAENVTPHFYKARPVPHMMRAMIDEELDRLQRLEIISPVKFSDWAAPIVPVVKADGQNIRICGDYKLTINKESKLDSYPIPRMEDLFACLAGGEKFSKLDMSSAYNQLELDESSKVYTTINTHRGLFVYNRCPFGVKSIPGLFQRHMEMLLKGIPHVVVYLDDVLITGADDQEHLQNLREVLRRFSESGLRLREDKCSLMASEVVYLGRRITADGLRPTELRVKAVLDAPVPSNVTELKAFLGMLNHYGSFLQNLSTHLEPLHKLLRQNQKWQWSEACQSAFESAKQQLCSAPLLSHYDPSKQLLLTCDASDYGIGCTLSHINDDGLESPIAYASRSLTKAERNYGMVDKEALACVFAVKKMHQYLWGRKFILETDHKPLLKLLHEHKEISPMSSPRMQRWALTLSGYDYEIRYRKGSDNCSADALSRLPLPNSAPEEVPTPGDLVLLMETFDRKESPVSAAQLRLWTSHDPVLSVVKNCVLTGNWNVPEELSVELKPYLSRKLELSVQDNLLLWGSRVIVPPQGRERVVEQLHDAHPGICSMKAIARNYVWWPSLDKVLEACVKSCKRCQILSKKPPEAPLHMWEYPSSPWSRIHVDFAGPFLGHMFLIVIDAYSKWIEACVLKSITAEVTIEKLREIFATHGLPKTLVSDNGSTFTSEVFQNFLHLNGIKHMRSAPFKPASNGAAERAVQVVKNGLKRVTEGSIRTRLSRVLLSYRTRPHSVTGVSPAELLMNRRLSTVLNLLQPCLEDKVKDKQCKQKTYHDLKSKCRVFEVGNHVLVKNFGSHGPPKLFGEIIESLGTRMFLVKLDDGRKVRRHVDQLQLVEEKVDTSDTELMMDTVVDEALDMLVDDSLPVNSDMSIPAAEPVSPKADDFVRRSLRVRKKPNRLDL